MSTTNVVVARFFIVNPLGLTVHCTLFPMTIEIHSPPDHLPSIDLEWLR
jgi:hypothetical protein